jgi:hypothetical protein
MFKIELTLRNSEAELFVQRKSEEDANTLYETILQAMSGDKLQILKLTCDRSPKNKMAVLNSEIIAVHLVAD